MSLSQDDHAAIQALYDMIVDAYATKNVEKAIEPYVSGNELILFDAIEPFRDVGIERLVHKTQEFFDNTIGKPEVEYTDVVITTMGGAWAYSHCVFAARASLKGGHKIDKKFRMTHVFRKIGDNWRIVHEHNSEPTPEPYAQ